MLLRLLRILSERLEDSSKSVVYQGYFSSSLLPLHAYFVKLRQVAQLHLLLELAIQDLVPSYLQNLFQPAPLQEGSWQASLYLSAMPLQHLSLS